MKGRQTKINGKYRFMVHYLFFIKPFILKKVLTENENRIQPDSHNVENINIHSAVDISVILGTAGYIREGGTSVSRQSC